MEKMNGGATNFPGRKMGGFDQKVHGKGSESKSENETRSGEKKVACKLSEKHYAHIK